MSAATVSKATYKFPSMTLVNEVKRSMMPRGKKNDLVAKKEKSASGKTYVVLYTKKQFERAEKLRAKKELKEATKYAAKQVKLAEKLMLKADKKATKDAERLAQKEAKKAEKDAERAVKKAEKDAERLAKKEAKKAAKEAVPQRVAVGSRVVDASEDGEEVDNSRNE